MTIFAIPAFAAVVATITSGPTLGCTLRFSFLATLGIVFGSSLAAATLLLWRFSSGGLVGLIFLQTAVICVPHGALSACPQLCLRRTSRLQSLLVVMPLRLQGRLCFVVSSQGFVRLQASRCSCNRWR